MFNNGFNSLCDQTLPVFVFSLHVSLSAQGQTMVSALVFSTLLWLSLILALRFCLKLLLSYHQWIFEVHGRVSNTTKVWGVRRVTAPSCGCCADADLDGWLCLWLC